MLALSAGLTPFEELLDTSDRGPLRVLSRARVEWEQIAEGEVHVWWSMLDPAAWHRVQQRLEYLVSQQMTAAGLFYGTSGDQVTMGRQLLDPAAKSSLPAWSLTVKDRRLVYGDMTLPSEHDAHELSAMQHALDARIANDLNFHAFYSSL